MNVFLLILLVFSSLIYLLTLYHRALLLSKNSVSRTVALGDMFLHYHEETHCRLFLFNPTDTIQLPHILTISPNSCPVTSKYTTASCLSNVFPFVLGNYWAPFKKSACMLWNGLQTWQINILTWCSGNSSGLPKSLGRSNAGQKDKDIFTSGEMLDVLTCTFIFVVSLRIIKQRWQFKGKHRLSTASQTLHCASSWFSSRCNCEEFGH